MCLFILYISSAKPDLYEQTLYRLREEVKNIQKTILNGNFTHKVLYDSQNTWQFSKHFLFQQDA